uniref:Apple domain-containing protein n=1 Tax=Lotharella oceanica TaxID=641309 RepID=A0A7S2TGY6_9EUKA
MASSHLSLAFLLAIPAFASWGPEQKTIHQPNQNNVTINGVVGALVGTESHLLTNTYERAGDICVTSLDPSDQKTYLSMANHKDWIVAGCLARCDAVTNCTGVDVGYYVNQAMCMIFYTEITDTVSYASSLSSLQAVSTGTPIAVAGNGNPNAVIPPEREFGCYKVV